MVEFKGDSLYTTDYTRIFHESPENMKFNAPHHFHVVAISKDDIEYTVAQIDFQEGPIKENGVNGVTNEDLINMVLCRLQGFQKSEFACQENAIAITKLQEGLMWLRKRTNDRKARGVEGTSQV